MIQTAGKRAQITAWGRFVVLGVFVFAWLNAAARPCMMAMELAPDMPMAAEHAAHAGHADHDAGQDKTHDCGHCPPSVAGNHQGSCASLQATDCVGAADINIDARQAKLQLKDMPAFFAVAHAPPTPAAVCAASPLPPPSDAWLKFAADPPLTILNCVFLK